MGSEQADSSEPFSPPKVAGFLSWDTADQAYQEVPWSNNGNLEA